MMRICKPNEAGLIFGQGSPSMMNWSGFSFVPPSPEPIPVAPVVSQSPSLSLESAYTNLETTQQVVAQASPPTFTSSMPGTVNTTVSVTPDNGWISTTVTMPSPTTTASDPTVTSSVPSTINPTSNAQPSTPDVQNGRPGPEAGYAIEAVSIGLSRAGSLGTALGAVLGAVNDNLGLKDAPLFSPETPSQVGPFGYPGYTQIGQLGFTAPGPLGPDPMGICGLTYGLDNAGISTGGESNSGSGTNSQGGTNDGMGPGGVGGW